MRTKSIREQYENTKWVTGEEEKRRFEAWKWDRTGYPIVDAGMRELYATGWMTQIVRMVAASFLVEYLRVTG
jgi:deoxyribodipyrimidine photo-lyase